MPQGALAVPQGDEIVPVVNRLQTAFDLIVASQDWHPAEHLSFASNHPGREPFEVTQIDGLEQILWPDHCVQGTEGAAFAPGLQTQKINRIFQKGTDPRIDSYSAFYDNGHRKATGLAEYLRTQGVVSVYIAGLAADVCVLYTALDAVREGFDTTLVQDATYGVNMHEGDVDKAFHSMREAGVRMRYSNDVMSDI